MAQTTGRNLPPPQSPFVETKTGVLSDDGYQYLLSLIAFQSSQIPTSTVSTGLVATGTNQATALQLSSQWNEVDTATSISAGVLLTALQAGQSQTVFNQALPSINVYPPPGAQIDAIAVNDPFVLASGSRITFDFISADQIRS